jgi:hypothetical protein
MTWNNVTQNPRINKKIVTIRQTSAPSATKRQNSALWNFEQRASVWRNFPPHLSFIFPIGFLIPLGSFEFNHHFPAMAPYFAPDNWFNTCYAFGDKLGEGGFGVVRRATHLLTTETVAIKIMNKAKLGVTTFEFLEFNQLRVFRKTCSTSTKRSKQ